MNFANARLVLGMLLACSVSAQRKRNPATPTTPAAPVAPVFGEYFADPDFVEGPEGRVYYGGGNGGGGGGGGGEEFPEGIGPFRMKKTREYCASIPQASFSGAATTVSVDSNPAATTGDLAIAIALEPVFTPNPLPVNPDSPDEITIKALCTLTSDGFFPSGSAPFCTFEASITYYGIATGKIIAVGTPPFLAITGGTQDLKGAYGDIFTDNSFSVSGQYPNFQLKFTADIQLCVPVSKEGPVVPPLDPWDNEGPVVPPLDPWGNEGPVVPPL